MIVATFARTSVSNNFVRLTVFNIMTLSSDLTSLQSRHTLVCALSQFDTAQHVQLQLLDVLHNKHLPVLMPVPQYACMQQTLRIVFSVLQSMLKSVSQMSNSQGSLPSKASKLSLMSMGTQNSRGSAVPFAL